MRHEGNAGPLEPLEAEEMVASVLRRTAGQACGRAEAELPDLIDGSLAEGDRALVEAHLQHCRACAELAEALRRARAVLPLLADLDPGPAFTAAVLARTTRRRRVPAGSPAAAWWRAWLARPRFAFELAYVATIVLVLSAGNPAATLQAASARAVGAAAAGVGQAKAAWPMAVARVAPSGIPAPGAALDTLATGVALRGSAAQDRLDRAWHGALGQLSAALDWIRGAASFVADALGSAWSQVRALVERVFTRA